jgi:hypothetical protein
MQRRNDRRVSRPVEGNAYMGLGPQGVELVRLDLSQKPGQHRAILVGAAGE